MRFKKHLIYILCLLLMFTVGCSDSSNLTAARKKKIAFISKMNYGYYWGTVKQGADTASREFGVDIEYAAPNVEEDVDEQIKLVKNILDNKENKIDALVLAASDYSRLVEVTEQAYDMKIPVIIIDSEVDTKKVTSFVSTDNYDAGKKAGEMLVNIAGKNCSIAVMNYVKGTRNAQMRENGLMDVVSQYSGIKVAAREYCYSDTTLAYSLTRKLIEENKNLNAIVALNEVASEGAAEAVEDMGLTGKVKIIAFDNTMQVINYLEKGTIQAVIIQNPFSIGYLGIKFAVDALNGKKIPENFLINAKTVEKDNMYLPENQKLLFPFVR